MFNTLKYATILQEAGFTKNQAETSVKILVEIMEDKLASKQDLQEFKVLMKHDLDEFRVIAKHEMDEFKIMVKHEMDEFKITIKHEMDEFKIMVKHDINGLKASLEKTELKLTVRMGAMMAASIAVLTALQKLT